MLSLDDLLQPVTADQFHAEIDDRKPLHIPADINAPKRSILDWAQFNALLDQDSLWTPQSLKLVVNGRPVEPESYCVEAHTQAGVSLRPSPAKVQTWLARGASLIAGDVQELTPALRTLSAGLSRHFAGLVAANVYCSFGGVQAFETHFDLHHVFAVQVEGEKTWRLYDNRADSPTTYPIEGPGIQGWFAQTRGPLMQEIRMRPGDVLYIPRGWYHDALATEGASLHVTFSITPLHGKILFRLLEAAALQDPAFRAWLPSAASDGERLQAHLAELGRRLAGLTALPEFRDEVAGAQERLTPRTPAYTLPDRPVRTLYRPTSLAAPAVHGLAAYALEWAMRQPQVSLEELLAEFDFVPEAALRNAFAAAERVGALIRI